ncbi:Metallophosphoesterase domain-containing protein 1 [Seminavis robusta]|uniref:Metallophosphoesterase domain-containing protein 1 n=1 Tax=Seminavis robusta TaxID=568900 RepID=A0A9N8DSI8_9STRA|nr:Metallophosphoesterase domain-containing protein 1 [Seminavis robusta]|eukprot:Sro311_g114260.1 Metallophosphoesterase domain-containing protein 1 (290) ;mRNA; r:27054-27923
MAKEGSMKMDVENGPMDTDQMDCDSQRQDIVRIVVISDTHGLHDKLRLPRGDVLVHCGDFADRGSVADIRAFRDWFQSQKSRYSDLVVIAGNHDRDLKRPDAIDLRAEFSLPGSTIHFLEDQHLVCAGGRLHIFGASWGTCDSDSFEDLDLTEGNSSNADGIDLLLSHIPPYWPGRTSTVRRGSLSLAKVIFQKRIPICCGGHLHWARGAVRYKARHGCVPQSTWFINAASKFPSSRDPQPDDGGVFPPVVIDYNVQERKVAWVDGFDKFWRKDIPKPFSFAVDRWECS